MTSTWLLPTRSNLATHSRSPLRRTERQARSWCRCSRVVVLVTFSKKTSSHPSALRLSTCASLDGWLMAPWCGRMGLSVSWARQVLGQGSKGFRGYGASDAWRVSSTFEDSTALQKGVSRGSVEGPADEWMNSGPCCLGTWITRTLKRCLSIQKSLYGYIKLFPHRGRHGKKIGFERPSFFCSLRLLLELAWHEIVSLLKPWVAVIHEVSAVLRKSVAGFIFSAHFLVLTRSSKSYLVSYWKNILPILDESE